MIIMILKKMINDNHHNWYGWISYALWVYHNSIQIPTYTTHFSLFYGVEAIMPLELEIPSLHVSLKDLIPNKDTFIILSHFRFPMRT